MSRDGTGNYTLPGSAFVAGTTAVAADVNAKLDDIASALTASIAKDGQTSPTADLPMANFKHTSVANAAARTQYASAAQVQDGAVMWAGTTGGTSTAYTATVTPGSVALVSGLTVRMKINATCGATPTFALNGLTAKNISFFSTYSATIQNVRAGQLVANQTVQLTYESGQDKWLVTSPLADPLAWYTASESVSGSSQANVDFSIPTGHARVRFEFSDCVPAAAAALWVRYSRDGGSTYIDTAAYYSYRHIGAATIPSTLISLTSSSVGESVTGYAEMQVNGRGMMIFQTNWIETGPFHIVTAGGGHADTGADITNVRFGFIGQNVSQHRIRMLAQRT